MCPFCHRPDLVIKKGFYIRNSDCKRIQRFYCQNCLRGFSAQTSSFDYRMRKRRINQVVFRMLSKGVSLRGCAQVLNVQPRTIARRLNRFGQFAEIQMRKQRRKNSVSKILIDEMESFEHTKLKPLTIPIVVEYKTRMILSLDVGQIAAKGTLAELSKKKYGKRVCQRKSVLNKVFLETKECLNENGVILSDESYHYLRPIKRHFPIVTHRSFKGRRGANIGQGEMKKGGLDPLFYLNHTYAMIRDNIKRLARKTWCTTKKIAQLKNSLYLYAHYHNQVVSGVRRPIMANL